MANIDSLDLSERVRESLIKGTLTYIYPLGNRILGPNIGQLYCHINIIL